MSGEAAPSDGRLLAWAGLVGVTIVLAFIVRQGVGLPEDFRYSYWTVMVGMVSSAITLGVVVLIAGRGQYAGAARAAAAEVVVAGRVDRRAGDRGHRVAARASSVPSNQ